MKRYAEIIILSFILIDSTYITAQNDGTRYKNRIYFGLGGEDGYLGIDYSRDIYKSKLFAGIGAGIGTGSTAYVRYEPLCWHGIRPFVSSGISHSFGGTLIVSPGSSILSASAGLNYLPELKWIVLPTVSAGVSYYSIVAGHAEGGMNGLGLLVKIGMAFPKRIVRTSI